jgi:hypothetical protein
MTGTHLDPHLDHLDTDTIADLIENLLPATDAHRAREHVKACPACQQTYDGLVKLSADLAEEGRADIPMPSTVAEHLDAVIVSESVLRSSTIGVHSLAQLREQPKRLLPRLMLGAAGIVALAAAGAAAVVSAADHSKEGAAGITPTDHPTVVASLATTQVGPEVQELLEGVRGPLLRGDAAERSCAAGFAEGQPNTTLRLVQPARVDGERTTVIGLQGTSSREVRVFVVTGCASGDRGPAVKYATTVTLRHR